MQQAVSSEAAGGRSRASSTARSDVLPSRRGFTLIEALVVLGIVGVLATLSMVALGGMRERAALGSAAAELSAVLSRARALALSSGGEVWLVLYPEAGRKAGRGSGAYFLVEDRTLAFGRAGTAPAGELRYSTFSPGATGAGSSQPRLLESVYLEDASRTGVRFAALRDWKPAAPFTGLVPSACNFCSGSPPRGAIVFSADGTARFVDAQGNPAQLTGTGSAGRVAVVSLASADAARGHAFTVSAPTSSVNRVSP